MEENIRRISQDCNIPVGIDELPRGVHDLGIRLCYFSQLSSGQCNGAILAGSVERTWYLLLV